VSNEVSAAINVVFFATDDSTVWVCLLAWDITLCVIVMMMRRQDMVHWLVFDSEIFKEFCNFSGLSNINKGALCDVFSVYVVAKVI
jgi:hypothetical protein